MALRRRFSHIFTRQARGPDAFTTNIAAAASTANIITNISNITILAREPVPLDYARLGLAHLPNNVVKRILTFLHDMHPEELQTIASLNSALYHQARYVQHHDVHIDLDQKKHAMDRIKLIKRLGQLSAIRTLRVSSRDYDGIHQETRLIIACLMDLIPAMRGLRELHWDVRWTQTTKAGTRKGTTTIPIPSPILKALPTKVHLHTALACVETSESQEQAREFLHRLANSRNLRTLFIEVIFTNEQECVKTMHVLKRVLLSCPNLTRIPNMEVWYPRGLCEDYGPSFDGGPYCGLGFFDGERPPALEELGIEEYPWGVEGGFTCQGYPAKGREWDYWANTFDWSRLTRLNDVPAFLGSEIAPQLTNLRELVLDERSRIKLNFLLKVTSPLESIILPDWAYTEGNPHMIARFGRTLKKLIIHKPEPASRDETDTLITASDLARLSKSLHHLEHLVLDISRDGEYWPYQAFDAIASFPRLRTVELWFPLGMSKPPPTPALTISSASHIFRYLRNRNKMIRHVTLRSGSTKRPVRTLYGLPDPEPRPSWHEHNSISFECKLVYNGEGPEENGGGWLSVWCPELNSDMNTQLRLLVQQTDRKPLDPGHLDHNWLRLKVALDGPLSTGWGNWMYEDQMRQRKLSQAKSSSSLRKLVVRTLPRSWKR